MLLANGVIALGTIGLLIYYSLPDLAMLRSVFSNADRARCRGRGRRSG